VIINKEKKSFKISLNIKPNRRTCIPILCAKIYRLPFVNRCTSFRLKTYNLCFKNVPKTLIHNVLRSRQIHETSLIGQDLSQMQYQLFIRGFIILAIVIFILYKLQWHSWSSLPFVKTTNCVKSMLESNDFLVEVDMKSIYLILKSIYSMLDSINAQRMYFSSIIIR
jgi:hypothetical protein